MDENGLVIAMGVSSVDGVTPVPITVDPVTGRLRCVASSTDGGNATPESETATRDRNGVPVIMGVTNDANETSTPLSIHNSEGLMIQAN